jgi:hypothetical protein
VKLIVEKDYGFPAPGDDAPIPGAALEQRDWWDFRTQEYPNPEEWRALGCDHRQVNGGNVVRRIEGHYPSGAPCYRWTIEVDSLDRLADLMREYGADVEIEYADDPAGHTLLLKFGERLEM